MTVAPVSEDARRLLGEIADASPEWRDWLSLVELTLSEAADPAWDRVSVETAPERSGDAPMLHGAVLAVDAKAAGRWVRRLFRAAADTHPAGGPLGSLQPDDGEALRLLEATVRQDGEPVEALAALYGAEPGAVGAVAGLAVVPLLQACGRRLMPRVSASWSHACCPVCAAWPAMAELRGLEGERRARCSRCGGDWALQLRRCPYCRTGDYRQMRSLVPEENGETRKVDACDHCKGYLKAVTTLRPWPADGVVLRDLATVDLDLAALERGYARPSVPARPLQASVQPAPSRRGLLRWRG